MILEDKLLLLDAFFTWNLGLVLHFGVQRVETSRVTPLLMCLFLGDSHADHQSVIVLVISVKQPRPRPIFIGFRPS